jgi:hypothetical protein
MMKMLAVYMVILLLISSMSAMAGELDGKGLVCQLEGVGMNYDTMQMEMTEQALYLYFVSDRAQFMFHTQKRYGSPSKHAPETKQGDFPYMANDEAIVINPGKNKQMRINRATIEINIGMSSPLPLGVNGAGKCTPKSKEEIEKLATEEETQLTKAWEAEQKRKKDAVKF